ncbi:hypothetical protein Hamer_G018578 [Homarus americanus]|uniref:Uncharacterized protein n=1 Tax=Homarus americanus TaxID=6706 RepID=A0A8J5N1G8_HOMAM|nr:hypothetical protein Hamer_G018578 [Homarus americanus]
MSDCLLSRLLVAGEAAQPQRIEVLGGSMSDGSLNTCMMKVAMMLTPPSLLLVLTLADVPAESWSPGYGNVFAVFAH